MGIGAIGEWIPRKSDGGRAGMIAFGAIVSAGWKTIVAGINPAADGLSTGVSAGRDFPEGKVRRNSGGWLRCNTQGRVSEHVDRSAEH
jgi:hypothetical protein